MNITIVTPSDDVFPVELNDADTLEALQDKLEMLTAIPPGRQLLLRDGGPVQGRPTQPCSAVLTEGDVIYVRLQGSVAATRAVQPDAANPDGTLQNPEAFIDYIVSAGLLPGLRFQNPALADLIGARDIAGLQALFRQSHEARQAEAELPRDPLDPEYQRKMLERIQQRNVDDNYSLAMEHSPEVFGTVHMLYVDMSVNGEPLKAFIDSGAQMTIMTAACAEKCHIMRLIDKRFHGMAVGVGASKILGRIHACAMSVGKQHIMTSVTVLEQRDGPQFIFGLDNLRRHQCKIDLQGGHLVIGSCDESLPFLSEGHVPKDFNVQRQQPEDEADELDHAGSVPAVVEGARPKCAGEPSRHYGTAPQADEPFQGGSAHTISSELQEKARQLQGLTGLNASVCMQALQECGGNVDLAASQLLGFS